MPHQDFYHYAERAHDTVRDCVAEREHYERQLGSIRDDRVSPTISAALIVARAINGLTLATLAAAQGVRK